MTPLAVREGHAAAAVLIVAWLAHLDAPSEPEALSCMRGAG